MCVYVIQILVLQKASSSQAHLFQINSQMISPIVNLWQNWSLSAL